MRAWCVLMLLCRIAFATPALPWTKAEQQHLSPGEPGKDYTPAVVPNGSTLPFHVVDGVKVFHLIAEPIEWEVAPGLTIHAWGYNGSTPGPLIEVVEGDRVRIYVTNKLPAPTTTHWHGVLLPCGMDGVSALTQPAIAPHETFLYEFIFPNPGTFMYHSHHNSMTQEGLGLAGMIIVHHRESDPSKRPDRDFAIMLHEWTIDVGTARPNTLVSGGFNILTMNGTVLPATTPLVAKLGDRVRIRYGNLSAMDHHPIHLHGYSFKVIGTDGGFAPDPSLLTPETTVLVPVGTARVIEFEANNPGDWIFHCHMTHHIMNQMGHEYPNMIGVDMSDVEEKIQRLIPGYMAMGMTGMQDMTESGMQDMTESGMPIPPNSIPMLGMNGQFGKTVLGGMGNILRVRENLENYDKDPGPYHFPKGSVAAPPTELQLKRDGITLYAK